MTYLTKEDAQEVLGTLEDCILEAGPCEHEGGFCVCNEKKAAWIMQSAIDAPEAETVEVEVDRGRVWIVKGSQRFMLAYDADTKGENEWYAHRLRSVLSTFTPDVKTAPQAPTEADGIDYERAWRGACSQIEAIIKERNDAEEKLEELQAHPVSVKPLIAIDGWVQIGELHYRESGVRAVEGVHGIIHSET